MLRLADASSYNLRTLRAGNCEIPKGYVIYGWNKNEEWLYIGMSRDLLRRVRYQPFTLYPITTDIIYVLDVHIYSPERVRSLERDMIKLYQPKYNCAHNTNNRYWYNNRRFPVPQNIN
jgi:excinuclease UvrABC nuclease subunit